MKTFFSQWPRVAGILLIGAATSWLIKLGVIVSTNGQIINTGAAALFMKAGLFLFLIGSTGIGNSLTYNRSTFIKIIAILLSPVVVFGSFLLLGTITAPLFKIDGVWYAQQEAPIAVIAILYFIIGYFLFKKIYINPQQKIAITN